MQRSLLVTDGRAGWLENARRQLASRHVQILLSMATDSDVRDFPPEWELLPLSDLVDQARLREEFLQFLDEWPARPVLNHRSFDDLFRQCAGYSVWWTGPGLERNVDGALYETLHTLWAFDRAIKTLAPTKVFIHAKSADLVTVLVKRCEHEQLPCEVLPGSARSHPSPWEGCSSWLIGSLAQLVLYPGKVIIRSLCARAYAKTTTPAGEASKEPAIVFASQFSRCVRVEGETLSVWFWQELCARITELVPESRCWHLFRLPRAFPGYRAVSFFYHTAWPLLRKIDNTVPVKERYLALGWWLRSVPRQILALWRYSRIEAQPSFRASFRFAGADVSSLYVSRLREAVAGISEWAQSVGAIAKSLQAIGNVRAMVLYEELYKPGTVNVAAARALGIPAIGVQHGMIMPNHLIYTLPRGQVNGGPIPDYFAATSAYAKEVMCRYGAYPADRVWITGSPRLDDLVNTPPNRERARQLLGLPVDKQVVLVTTQTAGWFALAVKALFEALKTRDEVIVCVKVHPKARGLSSDGYRLLAQRVGASNVLCFDNRFDELLAACDVLISASSTTILEATLLGRPTICVNFSGEPDRFPYIEDGASLPARSRQEMEQALELVLSARGTERVNAERRRFLARHAGPSATGNAGLTLAKQILQLACPAGIETDHAAPSGLPVADAYAEAAHHASSSPLPIRPRRNTTI